MSIPPVAAPPPGPAQQTRAILDAAARVPTSAETAVAQRVPHPPPHHVARPDPPSVPTASASGVDTVA
jgi:hypothetical protein